ncbi:S8 family serine peptidase [Candidatus Sumerlaeota bacterium]|nr:S8 family serine peptidase [Candidatus Sumerlaeota bacterium]
MKRTLLCFAILIGCSGAMAQTTPTGPTLESFAPVLRKPGRATLFGPSVRYDYQRKGVALRQDMARVAVELADDTRGLKIRANRVLRRLPNAVFPLDTHKDYVRSRFILEWDDETLASSSLVRAVASSSSPPTTQEDMVAEWNSRAEQLRLDPGVKAVWPVYVYPPTGINVFCPGEVAVKLNGGATSATLAREAAALGLEIDRINPSMPQLITLRQKDPTNGEPFGLARKLAAHKNLVSWVTPNLTQRYKLASNWVPWPTDMDPSEAYQGTDPLFAQQWNNIKVGYETINAELAQGQWPGPGEIPDPTERDGAPYPIWQLWRPPALAIVDTGCDFENQDLVLNTWVNWGEWQHETMPLDGFDNDNNGYYDDLIGWDFFENDYWPQDENGHGTACAGIACARGYNGVGMRGGGAFMGHMVCRAANAEGVFPSDAICAEAIIYGGRMARAVSCSWGGGAPSEVIHEAILYCLTFGNGGLSLYWVQDHPDGEQHGWWPQQRGAGALCFFAAGNEWDNELSFPAADPWVISVGATLQNDTRSEYSNSSGPSARLDIVAPGGSLAGDITATDIRGAGGYSATDYTSNFNGTSAATPLAAVTGLLAQVYNRKSFPTEYLRDRWYITLWKRPDDVFNDYVDPRRYTAGEIVQALLHGTDKVDPDYGIYDDYGYSLQYGWGRLNAPAVMHGVAQGLDDVYELASDPSNPDDNPYFNHDPATGLPNAAYRPRYLRPGIHKHLLARDTDYYLISLEPGTGSPYYLDGSSARITLTYPRWVWGWPNDWNWQTRYAAMADPYGGFADETTSPRLRLDIWPNPDPFDPARHDADKQFNGEGYPIHPLPQAIGIVNAGDGNRMEDVVEANLRFYEWANASGTGYNPNQSVPPRPYLRPGWSEDEEDYRKAFYVKVQRLPQWPWNYEPGYFHSGQFGVYSPIKTHLDIVEYTLNFEYCPPSNWDYYADVPMYADPEIRKSFSYSPLYRYTIEAALQEDHYAGIYNIGHNGVQALDVDVPMDYKEHYNSMITYNGQISQTVNQLWEMFPVLSTEKMGQGIEDSVEIWSFQAHRQDQFTAEIWTPNSFLNDYHVGAHFSIVENVGGTGSPDVPVEFTAPVVAPNLSLLERDYYPFEYLTNLNNGTKTYRLQLDAMQGARITIAEEYMAWPLLIEVWDERGKPFAWELDGGRTNAVTIEPQDRATQYTVRVGFYNPTGIIVPVGTKFRYQLAVDRYHMGRLHPTYDPAPFSPAESIGLGAIAYADFSVDSFSIGPNPASSQTPAELNCSISNRGNLTTTCTLTLLMADEGARDTGSFFDSDNKLTTLPLQYGPVRIGAIAPGETKTFLDVNLNKKLPEGKWDWRLIASAPAWFDEYDLTNNVRDYRTDVVAHLPDLWVESHWPYPPGEPTDADMMIIGFNTRNGGTDALTTNTGYTIELEGIATQNGAVAAPIAAGSVRDTQHAFVYQLQPGDSGLRLLRITVDPGNVIAELDETNNVYERYINIQPARPDLRIVSWSTSPARLFTSYDTHVLLTIENAGTNVAGATTVDLALQGGSAFASKSVPSLAIGAQTVVDFNLGKVNAGTFNLNATVDPANAIVEEDEGNNTTPLSLTVDILGVQSPWQIYE